MDFLTSWDLSPIIYLLVFVMSQILHLYSLDLRSFILDFILELEMPCPLCPVPTKRECWRKKRERKVTRSKFSPDLFVVYLFLKSLSFQCLQFIVALVFYLISLEAISSTFSSLLLQEFIYLLLFMDCNRIGFIFGFLSIFGFCSVGRIFGF